MTIGYDPMREFEGLSGPLYLRVFVCLFIFWRLRSVPQRAFTSGFLAEIWCHCQKIYCTRQNTYSDVVAWVF